MSETTASRRGLELREATGAVPGRLRHYGVLACIVLVALALVPGIVLRLGLAPSVPGEAGQWLGALDAELQKIEFGRGLRFWLGVTGAGMLAMLLLYPLRKLMGLSRLVSITAWFNLHVVLGLVGPALILYHTNFGLGSRPANVALFTTLMVAASGVVGYFLYTRYSATFYSIKAQGRASLDGAIGLLGGIEAGPTKDRLIEDLKQFDQRMLEERRGFVASARSSYTIRGFQRDAMTRAAYLIEVHGAGLSPGQRRDLARNFRSHLRRYFALVRRSERWSIYERLWAKWRLMHLPVFAITVIAATIHVVKVWDIDSPAATAASEPQAQTADVSAAARSEVGGSRSLAEDRAAAGHPRSPLAVRPIRTMAVPADAAGSADPTLVQGPKLAHRPVREAVRQSTVTASVAANGAGIAASQSAAVSAGEQHAAAEHSEGPAPGREAVASARTETAKPAVQATAQLAPAPAAPAPPVAAKKAPDAGDADAAIAELARRNTADNRGRFDPATLAQRLAQLRADKFDHSKTGFPLTGKHANLKCESCHKATLKDTKKECIACHKKDDVHKGRRPDCAQCHTTTDWTRLIKKQ